MHGFPIAVERAYIDVRGSGANSYCFSTLTNPGVYKGSQIFVHAVRPAPQVIELVEDVTWHADGAPYPVRARVLLFDLNLFNAALIVSDNCIEQFRMFDRKKQK